MKKKPVNEKKVSLQIMVLPALKEALYKKHGQNMQAICNKAIKLTLLIESEVKND